MSLKTSVFCLTHTNCTFMHLCYLYLLLIFQRYIISQRSSYIHGISFCTKRKFYSKPEREREKKKRKCNAFHVIWILVNEKNVRHGQRECMRAEPHDDVTQFAIGFKINLVFNEAKSHRTITNSKKYNQHYSARECAILFYLLNVNRSHFLNTKINIRWPTKMLFQMSDRNVKTINIDCFVV